MTPRMLARYCALSPKVMDILRNAINKYDMSARAYDRILKVARTIADLAGSETIEAQHMNEAVSYRNLDRSTWGRTDVSTPF